MAIDIAKRTTETYLNEDQRWLKGGILYAPADSILLDRSAFPLTTTFDDGYIPSGVFLARVTATGLYVPYADAGEAGAPGTGVARGMLLTSVPYDRQSDGDIAAALAVRCDVIENYLPTGHGLDAAARAELPHMRFFTYNV
jgi:hypothetical protein